MGQEETLLGGPGETEPVASQAAADATLKIPKTGQTRLTGRWLTAARVVWVLMLIINVAVAVVGIPAAYTQAHIVCAPPTQDPTCGGNNDPRLPYEVAQQLERQGISLDFNATMNTVPPALIASVFVLVAVFIFWHRSDDRMALLASLALMTFGGATITPFAGAIRFAYPSLQFFAELLEFLGGTLFATFIYLFPDGHFSPRWMRWVLVAGIAWQVVTNFFPNSPLGQNPLLFVLVLSSVIFTQVYRYRHTTIPAQRQQTKWFVFGVVIGLSGAIVAFVGWWVYPIDAPLWIPALLLPALQTISICLLPLSLTVAVLRYRLWDVDFLINRSLVYGALTVLVLAVFGMALLIISQVFQNFAGGPLVAVAVAALVFGLVFQPLRLRVQRFVDRRLYGIRINYQHPLSAPVPSLSASVSNPAQQGGTLGQQFGTFETQELIGRGGMAEIYKGRHTTLGKTVAIKILPAHLVQDAEFRKRFEREARTVAALKHPNIVEVYDFGEANGLPYMVMEYIAGQDLGDYLRISGRLPLHQALPLIQDIAAALDYAHQQGVVHRDIKASNVMLEPITTTGQRDKTHRAVLMDFGIAKIVGGGTRLTQAGMMGTLEYIAPEQIQDSAEVDARADVYAFGVLIYQMLTGTLPFPNTNPGALVLAHLQQPPPDPRRSVPEISERAATALQRALAKLPAERFPSAGAFAAAIAQGASAERRRIWS